MQTHGSMPYLTSILKFPITVSGFASGDYGYGGRNEDYDDSRRTQDGFTAGSTRMSSSGPKIRGSRYFKKWGRKDYEKINDQP